MTIRWRPELVPDSSLSIHNGLMGEYDLTLMALIRRPSGAYLTGDQKARKLGHDVMPGYVQTTPHLFGWLLFEGFLEDSDKHAVIAEHEGLNLPLSKYFEEVSEIALRFKAYSE